MSESAGRDEDSGAGHGIGSRWGNTFRSESDAIRADLGAAAATQFDDALLAFQRRRCFWYCVAGVVVTLLFFVLDLADVSDTDWTSPEALADLIDPGLDGALALVYAGFAVAFQRIRGPRARVLSLFSWLLVIAGCGLVVVATSLWSRIAAEDPSLEPWRGVMVAGATSITVVFLVHFLASLFVALSPREALVPLIPITLVFVASMLYGVDGPPRVKWILIACWPLAGLPGVVWSTWRHRRFVERFRVNFVQGRYREVRDDLVGARRIHESLFPARCHDGPVRTDWAYEPMREVGGDYLFTHRRSDGGVLMVVVDIAGHGVGSALAATRVHMELERLVGDAPLASAGDALIALNRLVFRSLAPQGMFASAIAVDMPAKDGAISWANAGHPSGLLRRESGELLELPSTTTLLGVLDAEEFGEPTESLPSRAGDIVVACTDGVLEARGASGEFFGAARFRAAVETAAVGAADRIAPAVLEATRRFRSGEPGDDVLIAVLSRTPPRSG